MKAENKNVSSRCITHSVEQVLIQYMTIKSFNPLVYIDTNERDKHAEIVI